MAMKPTALGTLLLMTAAAAQAGEKLPKCFEAARDGHCVAVQVNGLHGSRQNWDRQTLFVQMVE